MIEQVANAIADMSNLDIAGWYLGIGVIIEVLTMKHPTRGELVGGITQIAAGAFFIGVLMPPTWNPATAVFVAPAGRVLGSVVGVLVEEWRIRRAEREDKDGKGTQRARGAQSQRI